MCRMRAKMQVKGNCHIYTSPGLHLSYTRCFRHGHFFFFCGEYHRRCRHRCHLAQRATTQASNPRPGLTEEEPDDRILAEYWLNNRLPAPAPTDARGGGGPRLSSE